MVFLKEYFEKDNFEKISQHSKLILKTFSFFFSSDDLSDQEIEVCLYVVVFCIRDRGTLTFILLET